jgi:hypothetical protein
MNYFVYLNNGGYIVSKFKTEAEADNLIAANEIGIMSKIAAPNDSNSVKYVKVVDGLCIAETDDERNETLMEDVRSERNNLLSQSDWTQTLDSPLSDSKKAEWATYRQTLRDLPSNTSDPGNPNFPDKPS